jgi:polyhydroxyalkanoate synthesis regulator phasin
MMGYAIGFILLIWLMSKAERKGSKDRDEYIDTLEDEVIYVTSDEMDELICRVDELEQMIRELEGKK